MHDEFLKCRTEDGIPRAVIGRSAARSPVLTTAEWAGSLVCIEQYCNWAGFDICKSELRVRLGTVLPGEAYTALAEHVYVTAWR
jgi:hypothetical protein